MFLHRCVSLKNVTILGQLHIRTVMVTDVVPVSRKDLAGTSFKHQ